MKIKNLKFNYFFLVFLLISITNPHLIFGTNGSLDPSFGTNGIVKTTIGTGNAEINSVAIQSDGNIVAGGFSTVAGESQFTIARYTTNGSLDSTFGTGGIVITTTPGITSSSISAIAIQTDGKIVASGIGNSTNLTTFIVARYTTNGSLDTTFGTNGIFTYTNGSSDNSPRTLGIQSNGYIVIGGQFQGMIFLRLTPAGALDTTFGTGGVVLIGTDQASNSIAIQTDGNIVSGGGAGNQIVLARLLGTDGSLDPSFAGGAGQEFFNVSGGIVDGILALTLQPNGQIVACGFSIQTSNTFPFVLRANINGSLDTTFGTSGTGALVYTSNPGAFNAIAIQSDGKIVAAGQIVGNGSWLLTRLNTNGTLDTSYGTNGIVTTTIGGNESATALAIQTNNNAVGAGFSTTSEAIFTLARYIATSSGTLTFSTSQAGALFVPAPGLLTGQTPSPTIFPILLTPPNNGIVTIYPDGSFVYVPNANFNGTDSFTYTINFNGIITSFLGTVSITVTANEPSPNSGTGALLVHAIRQKYGTKS